MNMTPCAFLFILLYVLGCSHSFETPRVEETAHQLPPGELPADKPHSGHAATAPSDSNAEAPPTAGQLKTPMSLTPGA